MTVDDIADSFDEDEPCINNCAPSIVVIDGDPLCPSCADEAGAIAACSDRGDALATDPF